ncbi:MAG: hypothetical protein JWP00_1496 [Chloroflexi bacterium]|nr:hypothetical protein [Chloroflexota bacterium]
MLTTRKFAAGTTVTPARSREELDKLLKKYGATGFGYVDQKQAAAIMFELEGRTYRFMVAMPQLEDFKRSSTGYVLSATAQKKAWEQSVKEQWRAIVATIKGKLIAVDCSIQSFEEVFMDQMVMANGQTVAEYVEPELRRMYQTGELPRMLPSGGGRKD